MNFTPEKIEESRDRAAMAAMVDVDTFLLALDDIEALTRKNSQLSELSKALDQIQDMADEDIRLGETGINSYQIEATARAALKRYKESL